MATQNVAPSSRPSSQKGMDSSKALHKDGHSVTKRLQQDLTKLMMCGDSSISAFPDGDNLFEWKATIVGGKDTMYEGQSYRLSLSFPSRYPYVPPVVKFVTPCYHPNVDHLGNICLDILKVHLINFSLFRDYAQDKWSALYDVKSLLLSIQSLLAEPNIDDPLNVDAAELWGDAVEFKKVLTHKYKEAKGKSL